MEQFFISFRIAKQGIRIRTVILIYLLLSGVSVSYAQNYSTRGEIYDFEIGDVFHFSEGGSYWGMYGSGGHAKWYNIEITDKYYSTNLDTAFYQQFVETLTSSSENPDWVYESYYETKSYTNLNSLLIVDSVYYSQSYNGRKISWNYWYTPTINEQFKWVDGCGKIFEYWKEDDPPDWHSEFTFNMVYYKKGEEEWGTPHVVVGIKENKGYIKNHTCFPNPFSTSTTIEYELYSMSNIQFTIYNMIGEVVYMEKEARIPQGNHKINWSPDHLPAGLYYAVLRSEEGVSVVKMIKQ